MRRHGFCVLTSIARDGEAQVLVTWSPDPATVDALKRAVPAADRTWDAAAQAWTVRARHTALLRRLAVGFKVAEWHDRDVITDLHSGRTSQQLSLF